MPKRVKAAWYLKVAKNTLVKRAVEGTDYECMTDALTGPLLYAFSMEDPWCCCSPGQGLCEGARFIWSRNWCLWVVSFTTLQNWSVCPSLPTYDQAIAILMGVLKAPVEKFVRTINEPHTKLVRTLAAVRDAKQAA